MILAIDLLGIKCQRPPGHLTNIEADLVVEVKPEGVLIRKWWLVVVDSGQGVQGSCHLEHLFQLILEQLLATAVVIEAEAR